MTQKPIFCVTHPRACSTAFERVFMTRPDLACVHEPFGDAFYYGPERMSFRYEDDESARKTSGFGDSTYAAIFDRLEQEGADGKRIFIKDIIHYLLPPNAKPPQIAPSLLIKKRGIGTQTNGISGPVGNGKGHPFPYGTLSEPGNPTVIPGDLLRQFNFTFLIRDPHYSIPSYYRCTIPPLDKVTGFFNFDPSEAGYDEVRRVFDYLVSSGVVGPTIASAPPSPTRGNHDTNGVNGVNGVNGGSRKREQQEIVIIDADDLLDNPKEMIQAYCQTVGLEFTPDMLHWEDEENQVRAKTAFEKWRGFHEDAIDSTELRARTHKKAMKSDDEFDREWTQKYGLKGANIIRQTVDANIDTYRYLKQFAIKVRPGREHPYDDSSE